MPPHIERSLKRAAPGAVRVFDNVVREGGVLDTSGPDESVVGVRRRNERLAAGPPVGATPIRTVGGRRRDRLATAYAEA